jgi:hypothetical protein
MKTKLLFFAGLILLLGCKKSKKEPIEPMDSEKQTNGIPLYPCIKTSVVLTHTTGAGSRDYYSTYHYDEKSRLKQIVEYGTLSGSISDTMHKSITDFFYNDLLLASQRISITFYDQPNLNYISYSTGFQYDPNGRLVKATDTSYDNSTYTPRVTDYFYEPLKTTERTVANTDTTLYVRFFYLDSTSSFHKDIYGMWGESYVYSSKKLYIKAGNQRDTVFFSDLKNNVHPEIWNRLDHLTNFDLTTDDRKITPYYIAERHSSLSFLSTVTHYEFNNLGNVTRVYELKEGGFIGNEYLFTY